MTQHDSSGNATARMVDALTDPDRLFEPVQLAFFMAAAMRWGYELRTDEEAPDPLSWRAGYDAGYRARVAEENAAYPPPPVFSAEAVASADRILTARFDAAADMRQRWAGGTAEQAMQQFMWEATRPDPKPSPGALYVRPDGSWDDERSGW